MASNRALQILQNKWVATILTFVIFVVVWQIVGSYILNPLFISYPTAIASAFARLAVSTGQYSLIGPTVPTLLETFEGFGLSILIGLPLGLLLGISRTLDISLNPYVNALYVTPRIAMIPLIIIWFGIGEPAIVFTTFFLSVFPMIVNTYVGVRDISKSMLDTAEVFSIRGLRRFRYVILPATFPFIIAGLRLSIGSALVGAVVAQMILSLSGLGYILTAFGDFFQTAQLMAVIIELMIIGVIMNYGIDLLGKRFADWKVTERGYR
ncbi:MAG: ABC transporter permease [Thaumarchaeota archaeon]|nr:ABC transporter permease [Nitrososphaerota archaeon]